MPILRGISGENPKRNFQRSLQAQRFLQAQSLKPEERALLPPEERALLSPEE